MEVWFGANQNTGNGGVHAAEVTWIDDTSMEVVTPSHSSGLVHLLVLRPESGQADMLLEGFRYDAPASSGGGCFSVSPPPKAGPGSWLPFLLGLALVALAAQAAVAGRVRLRGTT
jgi:hypothetical protein